MGWTLTGLFLISATLLTISLLKSFQASKENQKEIDMVHISIMKEINSLQESIRNIDLDMEVMMKETGIQLSSDEKLFMREILDLYKRNYSIESIAAKKQVSESEIARLLSPFQNMKDERRLVANAN
ncbi:hypothetical protein [Peribacillus alkalitolerans]|uniref:hypothetical protein n=1 Tax=Peribacillus alkalitolerans TaxID=1550385 RepID=UPI0013D01BCE|nr:hypothetical protein [Peribacillus alkalitolerans]